MLRSATSHLQRGEGLCQLLGGGGVDVAKGLGDAALKPVGINLLQQGAGQAGNWEKRSAQPGRTCWLTGWLDKTQENVGRLPPPWHGGRHVDVPAQSEC